ncbi:glycine betaine ABC transporter substrate-binding protein [Aureimonas mangrovi]|uniref:glycine betaine ABC transporter substrate-binding protein n=1 Tax=Aureimonas mangrovi TaxID=2758041 RepID=UPI00163D94A4|nr:glycine betaine ABC transporter substrate-binding protein [Aureimonas mangrovi]
MQKRRSTLILTGAALLGFAAVPQASAQPGGEIRIGMKEWAENVAVSNMWKQVLEEKGYSVSLTTVGRVISFASMATGDLDLDLESWLPATDAELFERYGDDVEAGSAWYDGARLGLVVPSYADIESVDDLQDANVLDSAYSQDVIGIESGSALMGMAERAMGSYELDRELITGSEAAMMAVLNRAYETEQSIVVTLWSPHWAFAQYDLKYLDDPQGVFGDVEQIHYVTRSGFAEDFPRVHEWLEAWEMDDQSLGSLMAAVEEGGEVEGVSQWIDENRELVDSWIE